MYFAIIIDKTTDNLCIEQFSVCFCIFVDDLDVSELFLWCSECMWSYHWPLKKNH